MDCHYVRYTSTAQRERERSPVYRTEQVHSQLHYRYFSLVQSAKIPAKRCFIAILPFCHHPGALDLGNSTRLARFGDPAGSVDFYSEWERGDQSKSVTVGHPESTQFSRRAPTGGHDHTPTHCQDRTTLRKQSQRSGTSERWFVQQVDGIPDRAMGTRTIVHLHRGVRYSGKLRNSVRGRNLRICASIVQAGAAIVGMFDCGSDIRGTLNGSVQGPTSVRHVASHFHVWIAFGFESLAGP